MKKLFLVLSLAILAACDKPIGEVKLNCHNAYAPQTLVDAKLYEDRVELVINDEKVELVRSEIKPFMLRRPFFHKEIPVPGNSVFYDYEGTMPDSSQYVAFFLMVDPVRRITTYSIAFNHYAEHACNIEIPVNIKKIKLSDDDRCQNEILASISETLFYKDGAPHEYILSTTLRGHEIKLTQQQALSISSDWTYPKNSQDFSPIIKRDDNNKIKNPCEILGRVKRFFSDTEASQEFKEKLRIEGCIDKIYRLVICEGSCISDKYLESFRGLNIRIKKQNSAGAPHTEFVLLTPEQALRLSPNWDYKNPKFYTNSDSRIFDHEKDACETLERVKSFVQTINK